MNALATDTDGRIITRAGRRQLLNGREFIVDPPRKVAAVFGRDGEVLWAQGESLLINGPTGVGKGTLLQQMSLRRSGALTGDLLGYPVAADPERLTVYLAMDRPAQITRSLKRMVSDDQAELLEDRMRVWKGGLPFDIVKHPELLIEFIQEIGELAGKPVGTVFADSLKDMATNLSSDETGGAINRAIGLVIAADIEFAASHHQRKSTTDNKKPTKLDDVYGSTWISSGAGSVCLLWGQPGDEIVEFSHLKQPAEVVGPFDIEHDHEHGITTRMHDRPDALKVLQAATDGGISAPDAAQAIYGNKATKNETQRVRRKLNRLAEDGDAVKIEPTEKFAEVRYRPTLKQGCVTVRDESVTARVTGHAQSTHEHAPPETLGTHPARTPESPPPYVVGGGERALEDDHEATAEDELALARALEIELEHEDVIS